MEAKPIGLIRARGLLHCGYGTWARLKATLLTGGSLSEHQRVLIVAEIERHDTTQAVESQIQPIAREVLKQRMLDSKARKDPSLGPNWAKSLYLSAGEFHPHNTTDFRNLCALAGGWWSFHNDPVNGDFYPQKSWEDYLDETT